ncbi:MAG TPA: endonuclease III [Patescibacteria group bacterium]|nr:endonuclease III [Patescibacteria group bacterium]
MQPRYDSVMRELKRRYPAPAASSKETPWEVLLFTALTARSKDDQVEPVFRRLMAAYPTPAALAKARVRDVERVLRTIGLYRSKARNAVALARMLMERHAGRVPDDLDALVELPAVGRKTASCVLVYAFGKPAIAVDTHVHRIANRLGWAKEKTPREDRTRPARPAAAPPLARRQPRHGAVRPRRLRARDAEVLDVPGGPLVRVSEEDAEAGE